MTKKHFVFMAEMVNNIRRGLWTNDPPVWAVHNPLCAEQTTDCERAVMTAEAFILLSQALNPRFDRDRFLVACGLAEKPATKKVSRAKHSSLASRVKRIADDALSHSQPLGA